MNLQDYFNNSNRNVHIFCSNFPCCTVKNVSDLWNNFISLTLADKNSVIAWHNLLVKYIFESDNPLLLCRLYESGGYKDKTNNIQIDEIRRTALTIDGKVRYMFVSNHDAAEMFNIVLKKIDADFNLFSKMIEDKTYKFHYQKTSPISSKNDYLQFKKTGILPYSISSSSIQEESYILSGYDKIGTVNSSVLNQSNRYLAHIVGVNDTPYLLPSGELVDGSRLKEKLSKGDISDWSDVPNSVRRINSNLSDDDIKIIKAHFLRFFDPLNYFATPSKNNHIVTGVLSSNKNIGEYWQVQKYVEEQYEAVYGKKILDEFRKYALVPTSEDEKFKKAKKTTGENISFTEVKIAIGINKEKKSEPKKKIKPPKSSKNGTIFSLTKKYISVKKIISFAELDEAFPKISSLTSDIKDPTRYFKETITLPSGETIRITNQIGDGHKFPKNRNYSILLEKFSENGISL